MASTHTESSLKALTVPKLKELLAKASLPQTGKKDELVARLLETPSSLETDSPAPESAPAAAEEEATPVPAPAAVPVRPAAVEEEVAAVPEVVEPTEEEKKVKADAEEAKRKARSERFGVTEMKGGDEALNKRAERFGLKKDDKVETTVDKSLAALDRPLGEKPERKPRATPAAAATAASAAAAPAAPKTASTPVVKDPELAKKIEEEEERKRKRAARFAPAEEPAPKEAKVDV